MILKVLITIEDLLDHINPKLGDWWFKHVVCEHYRHHRQWMWKGGGSDKEMVVWICGTDRTYSNSGAYLYLFVLIKNTR